MGQSAIRPRAVKTIVLISCVSEKLSHKAKAKDLYISALFTKALAYARCLHPDAVYILSARYGLLDLETEIEPYDLTLNVMGAQEIRSWSAEVLRQLRRKTDLQRDRFIFLAGNKYRKYLTPHLAHCKVPMEGLPIGKQLQFLSSHTNNCSGARSAPH